MGKHCVFVCVVLDLGSSTQCLSTKEITGLQTPSVSRPWMQHLAHQVGGARIAT
jgi:hypothetical protein